MLDGDITAPYFCDGPREVDGLAVSSGWFAENQRISVVYPDGRRITRAFDGLDRITEIGSVRNATSELVAEYRYLGPWRVLEREYGNGTLLSYRQGSTQTGYDEGRRIVVHRHFGGSGDLLAGFAYGYDREDNRLFEEREHAPNTRRGDNWTYDSAYRLTSQERDVAVSAIGNPGLTTGAEARDWTLDGVGNWSQFAITPETGPTDTFAQSINEMNEYVDFGGVPQTHDENGNLTDSGEFSIEYDFLNRIRRVTRKADNRLVAEYAYDGTGMAGRFGAGRRVRRTVTNSGKLNTDVTYFCDGPRVVEERSGDRETTLRQYVDGIGLDEHLTMDVFPGAQAAGAGGNGQGQGGPPPGRGRLPASRQRRGPPQLPPPAQAAAVRTFFFHEDGKGWVAALSDEQGNLVERVTYDAYGEPRFEDADGSAVDDQSSSRTGNPYLYTGRRFDPETRFYYYRHRYYRPETGRFVSRDPLGYGGGGMGLYEYVGGNAINRWDPWGLDRENRRRIVQRYRRGEIDRDYIENQLADFARQYGEARARGDEQAMDRAVEYHSDWSYARAEIREDLAEQISRAQQYAAASAQFWCLYETMYAEKGERVTELRDLIGSLTTAVEEGILALALANQNWPDVPLSEARRIEADLKAAKRRLSSLRLERRRIVNLLIYLREEAERYEGRAECIWETVLEDEMVPKYDTGELQTVVYEVGIMFRVARLIK